MARRRKVTVKRRAVATRAIARPAKRSSSAAKGKIAKLQTQIAKQSANMRKLRQEYKAPATAAANGALMVGGSAAMGALKALTGRDYVAGVAIEVPAALATAIAGFYLKNPMAVYAAAGMLAPLAHDLADGVVTSAKNGTQLNLSALLAA